MTEKQRLIDKYNRLVAEMNRNHKGSRRNIDIWKKLTVLGRQITLAMRRA